MALININKVGQPLDQCIAEALKTLELPECFGHAYPDVIMINQEFSEKEFTSHKSEADKDDIPLMSVVSNSDIGVYQDRFINKKGVEAIEDFKKDSAMLYATRLSRCAECKHFDRCNEITKNYLKAVEARVLFKINDAI